MNLDEQLREIKTIKGRIKVNIGFDFALLLISVIGGTVLLTKLMAYDFNENSVFVFTLDVVGSLVGVQLWSKDSRNYETASSIEEQLKNSTIKLR